MTPWLGHPTTAENMYVKEFNEVHLQDPNIRIGLKVEKEGCCMRHNLNILGFCKPSLMQLTLVPVGGVLTA